MKYKKHCVKEKTATGIKKYFERNKNEDVNSWNATKPVLREIYSYKCLH